MNRPGVYTSKKMFDERNTVNLSITHDGRHFLTLRIKDHGREHFDVISQQFDEQEMTAFGALQKYFNSTDVRLVHSREFYVLGGWRRINDRLDSIHTLVGVKLDMRIIEEIQWSLIKKGYQAELKTPDEIASFAPIFRSPVIKRLVDKHREFLTIGNFFSPLNVIHGESHLLRENLTVRRDRSYVDTIEGLTLPPLRMMVPEGYGPMKEYYYAKLENN